MHIPEPLAYLAPYPDIRINPARALWWDSAASALLTPFPDRLRARCVGRGFSVLAIIHC